MTQMTNSSPDFQFLIQGLAQTHVVLQGRAARSVDLALVVRNWLYGWHMVTFERAAESRAELYGKELIAQISRKLADHGIKGVSPTNLRQCRSFYLSYQKIHQTLSAESLPSEQIDALWQQFTLGWSHYVLLLTIDNMQERSFYEIEAAASSWGVRELKRQITASLYERLALSRDASQVKDLAQRGQVVSHPQDVLKNPYVLEFLDLPEAHAYSEHDLETAIIDQLETFLLELGIYNRLLKCYVLIDLKRDKLTHQDLGQMQMYVNYFDRHVKLPDEAPTLGIVLCHRKNDALVELTLPENANIYAAKYQLYLPSKDELRAQIEASLASQNSLK
jgi:predicted nuclease of restriction endonuclease-like (RecB) superfamily